MKNTLFLFALLSVGLQATAQIAELGMNENEVYGMHRYDNLKPGTNKDGNRTLTQQTTMGTLIYNFDSVDICKSTNLFVDNPNVVQKLVNQYNDKYDPISDGAWRTLMKEKGVYLYILKTEYIFSYFTIPKDRVEESEKKK